MKLHINSIQEKIVEKVESKVATVFDNLSSKIDALTEKLNSKEESELLDTLSCNSESLYETDASHPAAIHPPKSLLLTSKATPNISVRGVVASPSIQTKKCISVIPKVRNKRIRKAAAKATDHIHHVLTEEEEDQEEHIHKAPKPNKGKKDCKKRPVGRPRKVKRKSKQMSH